MDTISDLTLDSMMFAEERTEIVRKMRAAMFHFLRSGYPRDDRRVLLGLVGEFAVGRRV
jgi:hypothetical protein